MKRSVLALNALLLCFVSVARADTYVFVFSYYDSYKEPRRVIKTLKETHPSIHVHSLIAKKATKENYVKALKRMKDEVKKDDVAIVFIYSHGAVHKGEFGADIAKNKILYGKEMRDSVEALAGTTLLVVDACEAGGLLKEKWERATVVCACTAKEESSDGCTTKAFVEALQGKADTNRDGKLEIVEVANYVIVRSLMIAARNRERQHPQIRLGEGIRKVIR